MSGTRTLISTLLAIATCCASVVAIGSTWLHHQLLNTDAWTASSVAVLRDPAVQDLTADFLAAQLVAQAANPSVASLLPADLRSLSAKQATALARSAARSGLRSGDYEPLWRTASRSTHAQFVRWLDGRSRATGDPVVLDLQPAIGRLGGAIGVPEAAVQQAVAGAGGAVVPLVQRGQFATPRNDAHRLEQASELTLPLAVILAALAVLVGAPRRRAVIQVGVAVALAGLFVVGDAAWLRDHFEQGLTRGGAPSDVARAIWNASSPGLLRDGWYATVAGAVIAIVAFATRPGRGAARPRR